MTRRLILLPLRGVVNQESQAIKIGGGDRERRNESKGGGLKLNFAP